MRRSSASSAWADGGQAQYQLGLINVDDGEPCPIIINGYPWTGHFVVEAIEEGSSSNVNIKLNGTISLDGGGNIDGGDQQQQDYLKERCMIKTYKIMDAHETCGGNSISCPDDEYSATYGSGSCSPCNPGWEVGYDYGCVICGSGSNHRDRCLLTDPDNVPVGRHDRVVSTCDPGCTFYKWNDARCGTATSIEKGLKIPFGKGNTNCSEC